MKIRTFLFTAFLVAFIGTASAVTINQTRFGPLYVSTIGGTIANVAFSNAFRGALIPWVGTAMMVGQIAKAVKMDYDNGYLDWLIPGKNNTPIPPQGWSGVNTPPSTDQPSGLWKNNTYSQSIWSSATEACKDAERAYSGWKFTQVLDLTLNSGTCQFTRTSDGDTANLASVGRTVSCPSGYTLINNMCQLSNPDVVLWPSDGIGTIQQDATGTFKPNPKDPDNNTSSPIKDQTSFTQKGQDEHGNQVSHTVKTTPDGGLDQIRRLETKDSQGNTIVQEEINHYNSEGSLVQTYNNTYNNTTLNQVETGTSTPPIEVKIPQITVSGNGGKIPPFDKTAPTLNESMERLKNGIYNLPFLGPLVQASQTNYTPSPGPCPLVLHVEITPFSFPWVLHTDVMCQLMETINPVLEMVMTFIFLTVGFYIIMSA